MLKVEYKCTDWLDDSEFAASSTSEDDNYTKAERLEFIVRQFEHFLKQMGYEKIKVTVENL